MIPREVSGAFVEVLSIPKGSRMEEVMASVKVVPVALSKAIPRRENAAFEYVGRSFISKTL
jgi:hypothetical protein